MGPDATTRRRRFGVVMLVAALLMLVAGETVLKSRLKDLGFLLYWLGCLVFTGIAIVVAYIDARSLQRRGRRETRELLENTLDEIQNDATKKTVRPGQGRR